MRIPSHLRALLTKNWILWKRNSLGSFLEFTIPILFALLFLVFRNAEPIVVVRKTSYYQSPYVFSEPSIATPFMKNCQSDTNGGQVALAPGDDEIIQELGDILAGIGQTVMYFENNQAIDDYTQRSDYGIDAVSLCFAVVMSKNNISNQYEYLIRYNISMEPGNEDIPNTSENRINQIVQQDTGTLLKYATSGFLTIQTWLDTLILRKETNVNTARIDASVASVTVPAHREDDLMLSLLGTPQYFIGMPLLLPFLRMINGILKEKEKRIREGMKIMGLSNSAFYVSWFITYFLIMTVLSLSIAIILTLGIFTNSSLGLIFLWHWGYSICLISFGTLITVFFSRAKVGNIVGFVIIFLLEWVQQVVSGNDIDATQRFWASLALPASVAMAGDQILRLEASQQGLKAHTANLLFLNYKVSYHFMWMAIETVVFLLLAVYLDQVIPSEFGVRKHPLFCLRRSKKRKYVKMSPQKTEKILTEEGLVEQSLTEENENFEDPDPALKAQDKSGESIMIRNLKKVYGNGKVAVDGVTYNMYKGQIFVLLGHNGAGKTTTISMMTGLYPSTEGTTIAFGMDINEKLDEIRKTMGVCPQHDVLFDDLTVKEHLELFAVFKGMNSKDINAEVDKLMTDLDLQEKKDYISKNLSGGQKRRLSIAIAFIGGSRFILLDEPSSGMDTSARRRLWDMLKNNKHGRVILLTTHYMDEADYLGDRIGIMGEGKMQCLGRPLFLKNQFGVGYTLTLSKKDPRDDSIPAIKFVQSFIPEAKVVTDVSLEISFQLPLETVNKFQELFENLDKSLGTFNLETYGVSVTTLEQVFLNVAKLSSTSDHEIARQFSRDQLAQGNFTNEDLDNFDLRKERISQQWSLFATQFAALMMKRFHYFKRDRRGLLLELLIPVIVIIGGILLTKANFIPSVKSIYLSDDLYGDTFDVRYGPLPTGSDTFINGLNSTTFNLTQVPTATSIANLDTAVYGYRTNADTFSKFNMLINSLDTSIDYYNYSVLVDTRAQEASAFSFNKLNNAVLKYATGDDTKQITVVVSPFEHTVGIKQIENAIDGLSIAFVFSIGMSFIPASLITFIVKERELTVKHQQLISGVSIRAYWFANYLVDIIKYMIPGILNSIMAVALDAETLIEGDKYGVVWALFLLYGFSVTSFSYLTSFLFKDFGIAQIATYFFHFGSGFIGGLSVGLLRIFGRTNSAARVLQWIFRPFPTFALTYGLMNLTNEDIYQRVEGNSVSRSPWALDLSGGDVLYLAITSIVYLALVFLVEYLRTKKFPIPTFIKIKLKKTETTTTPKYIDEDVKEEVRKIEEGIIPNLSIKVDKLRKLYSIGKGKHKVAVNQVSFGVQNGDCFALLGVNGAGKTTTFKMLTGDVIPSSGKAYINGYEIPSKLAHARHDIGYCPQNDPLLENLTAKEHLYLYTAIRGIPSYKRKRMIQKQLKDMSLTEYANVPANALSGGNKRKLAVAIAMVGNPPIVFLDEPSTGMDPEARRFMWNVISRISRERKKSSVVLTTHSMEEAEALSTKIGIMVDGVMVCIGSAQHIKSKYGGGYEVEVKLNLVPKKKVQENIKSLNYEPNTLLTKSQIDSILKDTGAPYLSRQISEQGSGSPIYLELKKGKVSIEFVMDWILIEKSGEKLKEFLEKKFDGAVLVEHFQSFYRFTISSSVGIGQVFGEIEANKNMLNIMQYSVRQSTIEQIFNMFASDHSHSMARKKLESYKQRAKLKEKEKEKEKAKEIALNIKDQVHETKTKPKAPISRIASFRTLDPPMKPTTVINLEEDV